VLLLRSARYEPRFVPASSLSEPGSLEGAKLLLLAPTRELSTERREACLALFRDGPCSLRVPVLELVASVETQGGEAWDRSGYTARCREVGR
jgi:hypothetical protein